MRKRPGRQGRKGVRVGARLAQIGLEQIGEPLRHRLVGGRRGIDLGERLRHLAIALRLAARLCSSAWRDHCL